MGEAALRRACAALAARRGCWLVPLWPLIAGLPDALLLAPGGRLVFVEFKTPTGRLSRRQQYVQERLAGLGFRVSIVRTPEQMQDVLDKLLATA